MSYVSAHGKLVKTPDSKQNARACRRRCRDHGHLGGFQVDGHVFELCGCGAVNHACDTELKCGKRVRLVTKEAPCKSS